MSKNEGFFLLLGINAKPEPECQHILPEPELENSGRQNYEKLFHISMNIWY
jgi:hypothetical protein